MKGYYEYRVISIGDSKDGSVSAYEIQSDLNSLGRDGWHVVAAYSNELGKNSSSSGFGGITTATNATVDQNILILERFVEIEEYEDFLPEI